MGENDNDSDEYRFGLDELDTDSAEATEDSDSDVGDYVSGTGLTLLPLTIAGAAAFADKAAVAAAMQSLFGAGMFATAVTNAFWVMGAVLATAVVAIAFVTCVSFLAAIVRRSAVPAIIGVLGLLYLGGGYLGATMLFGGLPLLVGFFLVTNLAIYGAMMVIGGLAVAGAASVL